MSVDLQGAAILAGLRKLESIILQPLAAKSLDLAENALTSQHRLQLTKLRKGLEQYLERRGDLTYIGFIGHFSSGKSSTINSLLGLKGSRQERQTGLHPTDTTITLITHHRNANSLLGVSSGGSVPIRIETLDHQLLTHLVVADSPGTGDPHLVEEMARDFLPICDLVIFVLPASTPIVGSDLPTLRELHRRLPFIPLLFVVTRADELRRDKRVQMSDENFDETAAAKFLGQALSRISALLDSTTYKEHDFFMIDNDSLFGVDRLRNELRLRSDPASPASRMAVHSHKLQFFLNSSRSLRRFFEGFLESKLTELRKIVAAAETNIQRYNEVVTITNHDLTKSWYDRYNALQGIRRAAADQPPALAELRQTIAEMNGVPQEMAQLAESIDRQARTVADRIEAHVRISEFVGLKDELAKVVRSLKQRRSFDGLTQHGHGFGPTNFRLSITGVDLAPTQVLGSRLGDVRETIHSTIRGIEDEQSRFLRVLAHGLHHRTLLEECEAIVTDAQRSLKKDLDAYFQSVQVYRAGVFAMGTKGSIARLGIGDELAQLESEFTDEDKDSLVLRAKEDLFPQVTDVLAAVTKKVRELADQVRTLEGSDANPFAGPTRLGEELNASAKRVASRLESELSDELSREAADFIDRSQLTLSSMFGSVIDRHDEALKLAAKHRSWTYGITGSALLTAGFCVTLGYAWLAMPAGQSVGAVVGWGVVGNAVATLLGLGIVRVKDNFPKTKARIGEHHLTQLANQAASSIDSLTRNHKFACLEEAKLIAKLKLAYKEVIEEVSDDAWRRDADLRYALLRKRSEELSKYRSDYLTIVGGLTQGLGSCFDDPKKNLEVLQKTSSEIKDRAIRPSFQLLEETSARLRDLRQSILEIDFS